MVARRKLAFEPLESRQLFSASALSMHLSHAPPAVPTTHAAEQAPSVVAQAPLPTVPPLAPITTAAVNGFVSTSTLPVHATNRWDWLGHTEWYVPPENTLAYSMAADLSNPTPVGDQTLWFIKQSSGGHISGQAVVKLSDNPVPTVKTLSGIVTAGGQIRIEFTSGNGAPPTTGIGQMRFVSGEWMMQMQMAAGSSTVVSHWAFMAQLPAGTSAPAPRAAPTGSLLSDEFRWLQGTNWTLADATIFGAGSTAGVFHISSYRNGYFWGSGNGTTPFNVFGSITPEGNVLLLVSANGAQPIERTGVMQQAAGGATMMLRSYDGTPGIGVANLVTAPMSAPGVIPHTTALLSSRLHKSG